MRKRSDTPFSITEMSKSNADIEMCDEYKTSSHLDSLKEETESINTDGEESDGADADDEMDIECALVQLDRYDNLTQLNLLKKEINHLIIHNLEPCEGWYDERFHHIQQYSYINWHELMCKFQGKDQYIYDTAFKIIKMCEELLEECSTRPNFHLPTYYRLIHEISNIWRYYHSKYLDTEEDEDIMSLINSIRNMMK